MTPEEALYKAITSHGRDMRSENRPLAVLAAEVAKGFPSFSAAARALDVPPRTFNRWVHGKTAHTTSERRGALIRALRRARLSRTREKFLRGSPHIVVRSEVKVSSDIRQRTMLVSGWPDPEDGPPITGMMRPVLDAWLQGHDITAADRFLAPIDGGVDGDMTFLNVKEIRFFAKRRDALSYMAQAYV